MSETRLNGTLREVCRWSAVAAFLLVMMGVAASTAYAQCALSSPTEWNVTSGDWSTAGNWSPNSVPNGSGTNVCLTNGATGTPATTTLDISVTVDNLQVGASNTLDINGGQSLTLANGSTTTNDGTIVVNTAASNNGTGIGINGAVTLAGTGSIVLNANSASLGTANIFDVANSNLTQGATHTISGTGEITVNTFTNNGLVNANSSGNTLLLTRAGFTNTNLMEATNGGILQLNTVFNNAGGTINANGGLVQLNGGTVSGGTLTSATGSEIDEFGSTTLSNVTLSTGSNLDVLANNNLFFGSSTITNNGTITVNKTGANNGTGIGINGTVSLAGTGSIVLNANSASLGTANIFDVANSNLTQGATHTISGTGEITVNTFTNNGLVNANSSGNTLLLTRAGFTNTNLMEATNGGILQLNAVFNNAGGTINANGGLVQLNGGSVTGGTLASATGSEIDEFNSTTLSNVTLTAGSNLDVLANNDLFFGSGSAITNNGTITLNKTGANNGTGIGINGAVDLTGAGSIVLNAFHDPTTGATNVGTAIVFDGGSSNLTQESGHSITGAGLIEPNVFDNKGVVNANVASVVTNGTVPQTLQIAGRTATTNTGTLEATAGVLELSGNVANAVGTTNGTILANGGNVVIDNGATITGGLLTSVGASEIDDTNSARLSAVTISAGTKFEVINGTNLLLPGGSSPVVDTNNGTITVNKAGANNGTGIGIINQVELAGTGSIVLNANSASLGTANIFDVGSSNLTQDVNHTISGTGEITVNTFTNNGTVNANSSGNTLLLSRSTTYNNANLMEATGGGILQLSVPLSNTGGTVEAAGGLVQLSGFSVTGGTLTSTSGSEIDEFASTTLSNVTLSTGSNLDVLEGNNLIFASGTTITNNGTITLNKTGQNSATGIGITNGVDLTGTGAIVLNAFPGSLSTANIFDVGGSNLTQGANHTISGTGQIAVNTFTNDGLVNANSSGNTLLLSRNSTYNNTSLMEATNGGILQLNVPLNNTGGTVEAAGGLVQLNGFSVTGGTLTSASGSEIDEFASTTLSNVTLSTGSNLDVLDGNDLFLASGSTITNNGTITLNKTGANNGTGIGITGTVDLTGTGAIVLNANSASLGTANIFDNGSSNLTQDAGHTISGTGEITVNTFTNNGLVNANSSGNTLLLTRAAFTNTNLMEATNGGILQLNAVFNNAGGTINANGGLVQLNGGSVTGGTLTSASASEIDEFGSTTLSNVTLSTGSNLDVLANNDLFFGSGSTITNNGTITVNKTGANNFTGIGIRNNVDLTGTGSIVLNANSATLGTANIFDAGSSNLTQDVNHTISGNGEITVNTFTNNGTLDAPAGDTLLVSNLTNFSGSTLTGGTYDANGTIQINKLGNLGGEILTNAANIILDGSSGGAAAIVDSSGLNALTRLATNQGNFTIENGGNANFTTIGNLANSGNVTVGAGTTLTTGPLGANSYTQTAGTTSVNGTLNASSGAAFINGGTLFGTGTITGATTIVSGATLQPGSAIAPGTLSISGATALNGTFAEQIASATNFSALDIIGSGNNLTLGSASQLSIALLTSAASLVGDTFTIMDATGGVSGTFNNAPATGFQQDGLNWTIAYNSNDVILDAVSLVGGLVTATWNTSSGNWTTATEWSCTPGPSTCVPSNNTPPSTNYAAVIDSTGAGNTLTLSTAETINTLTLQAGTLDIASGGNLNLAAQPGGITDIPSGAGLSVEGTFTAASNSGLAGLTSVEGTLTLDNGQTTSVTPGGSPATLTIVGGGSLTVSAPSTALNVNGGIANLGAVTVGSGASLSTSTLYDQTGSAALTDVSGTLTAFQYDNAAGTTHVEAGGALNTTATSGFTYDQSGGTTRVGGSLSTFQYDSTGGTTQIDSTGSLTTTTLYDQTGSAALTDVSGTLTAFQYDNSNGTTHVEAGGMLKTTGTSGFTYDQSGGTTDVGGSLTTFQYDSTGGTTQIDSTGSLTATTLYDESGTAALTDVSGMLTAFQYDNGNGTTHVEAGGTLNTTATSGFTYNQSGGLTQVDGHLTTYQYDSTGGNTLVTNGGNLAATFQYDQSGSSTSTKVSAGGTISGGNYIQSGGTTTVDGGMLVPAVQLNGGTLTGIGSVQGNVTNNGGTLDPGDEPGAGTFTITGDYSQGASGTFITDIDGGSSFDLLDIGGTASLGGTLDINLPNGFGFLTNGEQFIVLDATGGLGGTTFSTVTGLNFGSGDSFSVGYSADDVTLTANISSSVVPEPASLVLLGIGLLGVAWAVRRRRSLSH